MELGKYAVFRHGFCPVHGEGVLYKVLYKCRNPSKNVGFRLATDQGVGSSNLLTHGLEKTEILHRIGDRNVQNPGFSLFLEGWQRGSKNYQKCTLYRFISLQLLYKVLYKWGLFDQAHLDCCKHQRVVIVMGVDVGGGFDIGVAHQVLGDPDVHALFL